MDREASPARADFQNVVGRRGLELPADAVDLGNRGLHVAVIGALYPGRRRETLRELRHVAAHLPPTTELWLAGAELASRGDELSRSDLVLLPDFETYELHLARIGARF